MPETLGIEERSTSVLEVIRALDRLGYSIGARSNITAPPTAEAQVQLAEEVLHYLEVGG